MKHQAKSLYKQLVEEGGHFYVCGDCTMAEHVFRTLKLIIQEQGNMTSEMVETYMLNLRVSCTFMYNFNSI